MTTTKDQLQEFLDRFNCQPIDPDSVPVYVMAHVNQLVAQGEWTGSPTVEFYSMLTAQDEVKALLVISDSTGKWSLNELATIDAPKEVN